MDEIAGGLNFETHAPKGNPQFFRKKLAALGLDDHAVGRLEQSLRLYVVTKHQASLPERPSDQLGEIEALGKALMSLRERIYNLSSPATVEINFAADIYGRQTCHAFREELGRFCDAVWMAERAITEEVPAKGQGKQRPDLFYARWVATILRDIGYEVTASNNGIFVAVLDWMFRAAGDAPRVRLDKFAREFLDYEQRIENS